jgi:arsenate reductase (thioredoxin)
MAEGMLNHLGHGRFRAYSAGSHPTGRVNPLALETLERMGMAVNDARSKSWEEFAAPGAPAIDYVITVCDNAAGETCPIWPGKPAKAHWGVDDPAAVTGSEDQKRAAFRHAAEFLKLRIERLIENGHV